MKLNLETLTKNLVFICQEAAEIIKAGAALPKNVDLKTENNLVTETDKLTELFLVDELKKLLPGCGFIAEEGTGNFVKDGLNWIIDPIDGTTNFVHGIPGYCISVALYSENMGLLSAVIQDPCRNDSYSAYKHGGAFLNGEHLPKLNPYLTLKDSLLATGFPYDDFEREEAFFTVLKEFTHQTRGLRRIGSAALDLAFVAAGKFGAFYEYGLNPWDVAAGILLVQEVGGICTDFKGKNNHLFGEEIIASNKSIYPEVQSLINQHF